MISSSAKRIFFILIFFMGANAIAAIQCRTLFAPPQVEVLIQSLAKLKINLDLAQVRGAGSVEFTALSANYLVKEKELQEYVEQNKIMSAQEFIQRIKTAILDLQDLNNSTSVEKQKQIEKENKQRLKQERDLQALTVDGNIAVFHRMEPGSFKMGRTKRPADVTITKPFEMMATQTTQVIWEKVDFLYLKHYGHRPSANTGFMHDGPTNPVESKTFAEITEWIDQLNRLSQDRVLALEDFIHDHQAGDVYRLPTEAEWEFVITSRGQNKADFHFGDDGIVLRNYAWFDENSENRTHPVAQLSPLIIDKKYYFYDMLGNVGELTKDWYHEDLAGGIDPQGAQTGDRKVVRGGGIGSPELYHRSHTRSVLYINDRHHTVGFRMVREVRP